MKLRTISVCIALLLLLIGCKGNSHNNNDTILYYPSAEIIYGTTAEYLQASYIELENRDPQNVLDTYLLGPTEPGLANPFPSDVKLVSLKQKDDHVTLILSDHFAKLTGIDLTTACVCLAKTAIGITNTNSVTISCETQLLDGDQFITITHDSVLLVDSLTSPTVYTSETTATNK